MLKTWMQLLRVPNLFTVPGDPLAGFILAGGVLGAVSFPVLGSVIGAALCIYSAGLLLNDFFDRHIDRMERPSRPIPSGRASARSVCVAGLVLLAAGVALAFVAGKQAGIAGVILAAAVLAYDAGIKKIPVIGPMLMGFCRAQSLILGAVAVGNGLNQLILLCAAGMWAYITAMSFVAREEVSGLKQKVLAIGPPLMLVIIFGALTLRPGLNADLQFPLFLLGLMTVLYAAQAVWGLVRDDVEKMPGYIARLIGLIIVLQAGFCFAADARIAAMALIALLPLFSVTGRLFHSS